MKNDDFTTNLASYNYEKNQAISQVNLRCKNFKTFKKLVEVRQPILKEEDKNRGDRE